MKTLICAIALTVAVPAVAQAAPATDPHAGHQVAAAAAPAPTCTPEHAAMGHCQLLTERPAADPHAGHAAHQGTDHTTHKAGKGEAKPAASAAQQGHSGHAR